MTGLAVLGGTFDPVHYGHLRPAEEIRQVLGVDEVLLIPAGQPPHRGLPRSNPEHRLAMTELAAACHPPFRVLDWEVRKQSPSYAVETLSRLRTEQGDIPIAFILGRDAFLRFDTWHRWREILDLVHLVVACRPGWAGPELPEILKQETQKREFQDATDMMQRAAGGIFFQDVTGLAISSTQIRELLCQGQSPRFLLPGAVLDYIERQGLYRAAGPASGG